MYYHIYQDDKWKSILFFKYNILLGVPFTMVDRVAQN